MSSTNSNISHLAPSQIVNRTFDSTNDAIRVMLPADIASELELAASDGDSILMVGTTDGTTGGTQKVMKLSSTGVAIVDGSAVTQPVSIAATVATTISNLSSTTKQAITSANSGVVVAAASCVGYKSFNLFTNTTSTTVGAAVLTVEISPHDTDNVWFATALAITPSGTASTVVAGTLLATIARRIRVSTAGAIVSGGIDIYLVMGTN